MTWLKKLWNGDYPLWKTYWLFNVLACCAFYLVFISIGAVFKEQVSLVLTGWGLLTILWLSYVFVALGGLWRSAQVYTGFWGWKYLSYLIVIMGGVKIAETVRILLVPFL